VNLHCVVGSCSKTNAPSYTDAFLLVGLLNLTLLHRARSFMISWQSLSWLKDFMRIWNPNIHFLVYKNLSCDPNEFMCISEAHNLLWNSGRTLRLATGRFSWTCIISWTLTKAVRTLQVDTILYPHIGGTHILFERKKKCVNFCCDK
jgi:hypothetical protein